MIEISISGSAIVVARDILIISALSIFEILISYIIYKISDCQYSSVLTKIVVYAYLAAVCIQWLICMGITIGIIKVQVLP